MPQSEHLLRKGITGQPDLIRCKVADVKRMTPSSVLITLDPGSHLPRFSHRPGQRVTFCLDVGGNPMFRSYNLVNAPGELPRIAVKKVASGGSAQFFNDSIQAGDHLRVSLPDGQLYDPSTDHKAHHLMLFAAGSGITPLISIAEHALRARPDHKITLIYANSSSRHIMLQERLDEMAQSRRLEVFHVLGDGSTGEDLSSGRLDGYKLQRLLGQFRNDGMPDVAFLSGPSGFMDLVKGVIQQQRKPLPFISYSFQRQPYLHPEDKGQSAGPSVMRISIHGRTREIPAPWNQTLLQSADDAGIAMPANCRSGICHRCKARLISGHATGGETQVSPKPIPKGWILCCQQRPGSDRIEIEMD